MNFLFDAAIAVSALMALGFWSAHRRERAAHRKAEEAQRQHSAILETIADSFFALDREGRFTFVTPKAAEMLGKPAGGLIGKTLLEALPELQDSDLLQQVSQALRDRAPRRFDHFQPVLKRWYEQQIYINPDGGVSVYGRDVTARRRLEDELRASEERFRRLVDSNMLGVFVTVDSQITEANDQFLEMLGSTRDELIRRQLDWTQGIPADPFFLEAGAERELVRKDGIRIPVWMASTRIDRETLHVVHDLTHRKRAENRLRYLAEATKILSASLDIDKMFRDLARFLSGSIGDSCVIYLKEDDDLRQAACASRQSSENQAGLSHTHQMRTVLTKGTSENVPNLGVIVPLPSRGKIAGSLFAGRPTPFDNDDVHLLEEIGRRAGISLENTRLYQQTEIGSRLKDEFVAALSHELRTPLTPILGAVYMLRSEPEDRRIFNKAVDLIERNARVQARLVEDLLDMSRIISGKLRLQQETVELASALESAIDSVRPACEGKHIEIRLNLGPMSAAVCGDPDRLQQIFWNILSNSVKFTPNGGRIVVDLVQNGDQGEVRITDTGIGIGQEFLPHVFERFRQEDTSRTRVHGGLGIGLAIVRHLVESHGGTVHAHSLGDQTGSTFIVRLPLRASLTRSATSA